MKTRFFGRPAVTLTAVGMTGGIAWAAGFRGYMVELAGPASTFDWWGTFGGLIFPGAVAGGAIAVALMAVGGGYAVSRRGPLWSRLACGITSAALLAALALAGPGIAGPALALTEPRGAWVAVLAVSFVIVLALASSIPHRPAVTAADPLVPFQSIKLAREGVRPPLGKDAS